MSVTRKRHLPTLLTILALGSGACVSLGPKTIPRDRFEYSTSITESWKRQTLLNVVKMRYADPPIFVDVGQIVSGYSLEAGVNLGAQFSRETAIQGERSFVVGGSGRFVDRPTITYTPLTGNKFIRGLMMPLPPESVFFTIQSGWPADGVLFAALATINGLKNQTASVVGVTPPDPEFLRVLELLRRIQLSGAVGMRVLEQTDKKPTSLVTFRSRGITQETLEDITTLRRLLGLDPEALELNLTFGTTPSNDKELAVTTRSILQIMLTMASQAEVPPEDVTQGRTGPGWESIANEQAGPRLVYIRCSAEEPHDAFVSVPYRDRWFWIDDKDLKSKRTFAFMMLLFTLADTGEHEGLPLITIPAQ